MLDEDQEIDLAALTKAFAQATLFGNVWNQAAGDRDMRKSYFTDEFYDEGYNKGYAEGYASVGRETRSTIHQILTKRFGEVGSADLLDKIQKQTNNKVLLKWLRKACEAKSLSAYENQINRVATVPVRTKSTRFRRFHDEPNLDQVAEMW